MLLENLGELEMAVRFLSWLQVTGWHLESANNHIDPMTNGIKITD